MAGDWIKMKSNLDENPKVMRLSDSLEIDELHVCGLLFKLWSWADQHTVDGNALSVTKKKIDRLTRCPGFTEAMISVGWLEGADGNLSFPDFEENNGQSAKKRALTAKRVAKSKAKRSANDKVTQSPLPREEKRRVREEECVGVPESLQSDEFCKVWSNYQAWVFSETGKPLNPIKGELILKDLLGRGHDKAIKDLELTMQVARTVGRIFDSSREKAPSSRGGHSPKTFNQQKTENTMSAAARFVERGNEQAPEVARIEN